MTGNYLDGSDKFSMELTEDVVRSMEIGAVYKDYNGKINSLDFHRTNNYLVTASDDESIRLFDTASATLQKTIYSKKYGVDLICFTHNATSVLYSSKNGWDESLRHLSLMDNRYYRYFKGHRDKVVSLCMSPDTEWFFMSGSLDHTVLLWDLRIEKCQGLIRVRGRPSVAYDEQGLVFAICNEGGSIKLFDIRSYDKGPFDTFIVDGDDSEASGIKFSSDGRTMLLSTMNGSIHILDAYQGTKIHSFSVEAVPDSGTLEASFTPDGKFVISGSGNGSIHAWNVSSGKEVACWENEGAIPAVVKWAPNQLMFASGSSVLSLWIPDLSKLTNYAQ
eukprot:TRINITY_DN6831_c0_g1_i1.p1 TRINITY_DN6831_c0_g1~~TRINITY_DN6831_c0_g1_i1.p1  ORF type:complete len:333 (-),score=76.90 TRINITY_DN6831_c0_g1_i1:388-1386(-)